MAESWDYAFTLTLRPRCYRFEPEKQYDDTYVHVMNKLRLLTQTFTLIAECTKNYNLHMHGIIKFPIVTGDIMKEFYKCFRNDTLIGFVNIRPITDMDKWKDYISKSVHATFVAIGRRPIIYDYYNVFDMENRARYALTW